LVLLDWINFVAFSIPSEELRWVRFFKANRILKVARLLRVATASKDNRVTKVMQTLLDRGSGGGARAAINITSLMMAIVYLNHVLACVWVWLAFNAPSDTGRSWMDSLMVRTAADSTVMIEATFSYEYLTALHWSITQMTPGSMEVVPRNTAERTFNVLCLLMGFIFFGSLISMLSAETAQYRAARKEQSAKLGLLQRYMIDKGVSQELMMQIKKEVVERMRIKKPLLPGDVALLSTLSVRLRNELHCETCRPYVMAHPLLRSMVATNQQWLQMVCSGDTLVFKALAPGDFLFEALTSAESAYVVISGRMKYLPLTALVSDADDAHQIVPGTWISEPALWVNWTHVGCADAVAVTELLTVNVEGFMGASSDASTTRRVLIQYAKVFQRHLADLIPEEAILVDDITPSVPERPEYLISLFPKDWRVQLGHACLATLHEKWHWVFKRALLRDLAFEVKSCRTTLLFDEFGDVQRFIRLVSMSIRSDEGRQLARVGTWANGNIEGSCELPTVKLMEDEHPRHAVKRMLKKELLPIAHHVNLGGISVETETVDSGKYGLRTKHLTTVQHATLQVDQKSIVASCCFEGLAAENLESPPCSRDTSKESGVSKRNEPQLLDGLSDRSPAATQPTCTEKSSATRKIHVRSPSMTWVHGRTRSSLESDRVRRSQLPSQIMVLSDGEEIGLYAWLQAEELTWLSSPQASRDLQVWLHQATEAEDMHTIAACAKAKSRRLDAAPLGAVPRAPIRFRQEVGEGTPLGY